WQLINGAYWQPTISPTFHGRDVFAPVAARLSEDSTPSRFGSQYTEWVRLPLAPWTKSGDRIRGAVQFVDDFGNLITNIPHNSVATAPHGVGVAGRPLGDFRWVRTYGEAPPGTLVVLGSSDGFVEVARVNGSAAEALGATVGAGVEIQTG